jgi:DNA repair exonuclease SbcCD ATPase subunit
MAALLLAAGAPGVWAQQPPPAKSEPPPKKAKKVWTDDDVKSVRKPWDEHVEKKAAEEAAKAEAAKKAAEAKTEEEEGPPEVIDPKTGKPYVDPESPEYLEKRLKGWEEELAGTEERAERARREMIEFSNDPDRWEMAKTKLETYEENIAFIKKTIEEHKQKLEALRKAGKPAAKPEGAPAPGGPAKQPPPPPKP